VRENFLKSFIETIGAQVIVEIFEHELPICCLSSLKNSSNISIFTITASCSFLNVIEGHTLCDVRQVLKFIETQIKKDATIIWISFT
jgi:hypothetical protein